MTPKVAVALGAIVVAAMVGRIASTLPNLQTGHDQVVRLSGDEVVYLLLGDRLWHEGRYSAAGFEAALESSGVVSPSYLALPVFKHPPLFPALLGVGRAAGGGTLRSAYWATFILSALSLWAVWWVAIEAGMGANVGLLAALLLAVSPVHWVSSTHLWLDLPVTAFMLLAIAARLKAIVRPRYWWVAALFWTFAILTKYVAAVGWMASFAAALWSSRESLRTREFWLSHAMVVLVVGAWAGFQLVSDQVILTNLSASSIDDWRRLGRVAGALPAMGLTVAIAVLAAGVWKASVGVTSRASKLFCLVSLIAVAAVVAIGPRTALGAIPWSGWGQNALAGSAPTFYVVRQLLFEPVALLGFAALVLLESSNPAESVLKAIWLSSFVFLTFWGNYQSRYGLPLVPLELIFAARLLCLSWTEGERPAWLKALGLSWIAVSVMRSVTILASMGVDVVYF